MEFFVLKKGVITDVVNNRYCVHGWYWPESALELAPLDYSHPLASWTKEMLQELETSGMSLQDFRFTSQPVWNEINDLHCCDKNNALYTGEPVYIYNFNSLYQIPDNKFPEIKAAIEKIINQ